MSLSKRYLLGMDLGTTNVKGIIMDEDGNIVASASRANELILPGRGWLSRTPVFGGSTVRRLCGN